MIKNIKIGTDSELFMKHKGSVISMIGLLGGTKDTPKSIGENCFVQEDNILAEFNIPPVTTKMAFLYYINYCKDWLEINYPELELHFASSEKIDDYILLDNNTKNFGCEPDYIIDLHKRTDEYKVRELKRINNKITISKIRTTGLHIHISYNNPTYEINREIVKLFEKYVTMPLVLLDLDNYNRRKLYGQSGSYRHKSYGVECRSLGGYFLANDKKIGLVWEKVMDVINKFNLGERVTYKEFKKIKNYINNKKIKTIKQICVDY